MTAIAAVLTPADLSCGPQVVCSSEVFGQIRALSCFRLPGAVTDYIVAGSDSGRIVILEFSAAKRTFLKVHQETFGRSGCRRVVPGQYVACDPAGRAVMVRRGLGLA